MLRASAPSYRSVCVGLFLLCGIVTEEKSNEVTAIPKLLELFDIRGATITVDAMG